MDIDSSKKLEVLNGIYVKQNKFSSSSFLLFYCLINCFEKPRVGKDAESNVRLMLKHNYWRGVSP